MKKICVCLLAAIVAAALMLSCSRNRDGAGNDLPKMPMKAVYENSLEYEWSQKEVLDFKILSDMESMNGWRHEGFGSLALTTDKFTSGKSSLLLVSPTKGEGNPPDGRPWGVASAYYEVNSEDWTDWNRVTFDIFPDMKGFKVVSISLVFHNEGEEKSPDAYERSGLSYQVLDNHKWNRVYWEIAHLGRERVTGLEIRYRLQGNEEGATASARYYIDNLRLEKVVPDHFEGWDVAGGQIAYNHAGYSLYQRKHAFLSGDVEQSYRLKNASTGKTVLEGLTETFETQRGTFQFVDFTDLTAEGRYVLDIGGISTKEFKIGTFMDVYRSSIVKTVNHFYSQRCGYEVEDIHDFCHLDWKALHGEEFLHIHGGWHDAGDLSQGGVNTAEAVYAMIMLSGRLQKLDPALSKRLLEEAEWGLTWVMKTRFGDGFRSVWATKDMWTDNVNGTADDFNAQAQNSPHANMIAATTEAFAAIAFRQSKPKLAAEALTCATEDYEFGRKAESMTVELAGASLNAALALYEASSESRYKYEAVEFGRYILSCQTGIQNGMDQSTWGLFYRTNEKKSLMHYSHRSHEQDLVVGLVKLARLFPDDTEWKEAIEEYASFYSSASILNAPYMMIPAGIYSLDEARDSVELEQILKGMSIGNKLYIRNFPVWKEFRGNSGTTLSIAVGLAAIANYLRDETLQLIAIRALEWHLGMNPFAQSLMYGEGYRFASQYSVTSGNIVGGLPVGVQSRNNNDLPYWPAENCYNWKEIWVHPSTRWLMLISALLDQIDS